MPEAALHLSTVAGSPLLDSNGDRLGRVQDVIARLDRGDAQPPVSGLSARIGGRELFVPADRIDRLEPTAARTSTTKLNLAQFERRPGEVLLRSDVLGRTLIDVETARLVSAHEVELVCDGDTWRVAGIDTRVQARMRRLLPRRLRLRGASSAPGRSDPDRDEGFIAWSSLEPFVAHVPTSRLRLAHRRLARLHPAQIADLVEAASHEEGEEILQAVGQDKELEADVFEELDEEHQLEFLRDRSDEEVAAVLNRMASDDAADLLLQIEQDRRLPVLNLMPAAKQAKIRRLLGYNPSTAGGLMNPDFVWVDGGSTVELALSAARRSEISAEQLNVVYVCDAEQHLLGAMPVVGLIRASSSAPLTGLFDAHWPSVAPDADIPEIARIMTDYNLVSLPVIDSEGRLLGVLSVDDVLQQTLPSDWRRRYGLARG